MKIINFRPSLFDEKRKTTREEHFCKAEYPE